MYRTKFFTKLNFLLTNLFLKKKPLNVFWGSFSDEPTSISDAFIWRTDNDFKTIFKFANIVEIFNDSKAGYVAIEIFSNQNKLLKKVKIFNLNSVNEFIIDKKLLGIEGNGIFYIYHKSSIKGKYKTSILNRCYVGYYKGKSGSIVHGNSIVSGEVISNDEKQKNYVNKSFFSNQKYIIQNSFIDFDKVELFFINPLTKKINVSVNNKSFSIEGLNCKVVKIKNEDLIKTKSNCRFLRPIIFTYKEKYFDVYHS